jgi:hypothetical protein
VGLSLCLYSIWFFEKLNSIQFRWRYMQSESATERRGTFPRSSQQQAIFKSVHLPNDYSKISSVFNFIAFDIL